MRSKFVLIALSVLTLSTVAQAGPRARRGYSQAPLIQCSVPGPYTPAVEALSEVNAARAARGLPPFAFDLGLSDAARACANYRAATLNTGHTANDFAALAPGVYASAAGCGGLEWSWGWGTCCTYDNYRYAGAAYAVGRDGKRYMHIFVR